MFRPVALMALSMLAFIGLSQPSPAQEALDQLESQVRDDLARDGATASPPASSGTQPGWLGVEVDDRNENGRGVRVVRLIDGSPAQVAGLREGDLITMLEGQPIGNINVASGILRTKHAGDEVVFEVQRENSVERIEVTLGLATAAPVSLPESAVQPPAAAPPASEAAPVEEMPAPREPVVVNGPMPLLGVGVAFPPPAAEEAMRLALGIRPRGAYVGEVKSGSPAQAANIEVGAVILAFDGRRVDTPADLERYVMQTGPGITVKLALFMPPGELAERRVTLGVVEPPDALGESAANGSAAALGRLDQLEQRLMMLEQRLAAMEQQLSRQPAADNP